METFENLKFWWKSHQLILGIYELTRTFPEEEKFGIISHLRRTSASVPANIAEGYSRSSKPETKRFFNIALSSLEETRYFLILSKDLGLINNYEQLNQNIREIRMKTNSYITKLLSPEAWNMKPQTTHTESSPQSSVQVWQTPSEQS